MKIIELTVEQEKKWLELMDEDYDEFLLRLNERLKNESDLKIKLSERLLSKLFIDKKEIDDISNEYKVYVSYLKNIDMDWSSIDFSNLDYHDLVLNYSTINFMKKNSIIINIDKIYNKDIYNLQFSECIIKGSFDGANIAGASFYNNHDELGRKLFINPRLVKDKNFSNSKISDVIFTDNFDGCIFSSTYLYDNENTVINPKKIHMKHLSYCRIEDAEFTDNFDDCDISHIILKNNKNTIINPQLVKDMNLVGVEIENAHFTGSLAGCRIEDANITKSTGIIIEISDLEKFSQVQKFYIENCNYYIKTDDDLKYLMDNYHISFDRTDTILCKMKYKNKLVNDKRFLFCNFDVTDSKFDDAIEDIFKNNNCIAIKPNDALINDDNSFNESDNVKIKSKKIRNWFNKLKK